ncbi:hypothetical protein C9E85_04050 [Plesiomonas shigelloides]|nr:hypothetical protein C9E85_04050 [Plesiomonas shigelloides]
MGGLSILVKPIVVKTVWQAFCLLPSAFCLLPSAFCLLPSVCLFVNAFFWMQKDGIFIYSYLFPAKGDI